MEFSFFFYVNSIGKASRISREDHKSRHHHHLVALQNPKKYTKNELLFIDYSALAACPQSSKWSHFSKMMETQYESQKDQKL